MSRYEVYHQAYDRLVNSGYPKGIVCRTPVTYDPELNVYLKWENQQVTGSFKVRGALNKILTLSPDELGRGLVTASAGNHGQGVALAAAQFHAKVTVFASDHAVESKIKAMRQFGAEVRLVNGGYEEAEKTAINYARDQHQTWISPYNDLEVIAGQSSIAFEMLEQIQPFDAKVILVPIGGGGLAAGVAAVVKNHVFAPQGTPQIFGVQSEASPYFYYLYYEDTQDGIVETESLADGLSGRVEQDSITIPLVKTNLDGVILVSEHEIAEAIRYAWYKYHQKIEGSAATVLAAIIGGKINDRPAVLIISGGNILPEVHADICKT